MRGVRRSSRLLIVVAVVAAVVAMAVAGSAPLAHAGSAPNPWAGIRKPARGTAHAIGGYSAGCLAGASRLPAQGEGFRVMLPARRRVFAHSEMVAFLRDLGAAVVARGLGILPLGDLSQARGGPAPSGHSSHQTGLDVDIWYAIAKGRRPAPVAMVDSAAGKVRAAWKPANTDVLALAAADARVDRIFVNPIIKKALCASATGERTWLHKLRPWWGHDEHFHVRLACPASDKQCQAQAPVPDGDGCDEIDWWLSPDRQADRTEQRKSYRSHIGTLPPLPASCAALLDAPAPAPPTRRARR